MVDQQTGIQQTLDQIYDCGIYKILDIVTRNFFIPVFRIPYEFAVVRINDLNIFLRECIVGFIDAIQNINFSTQGAAAIPAAVNASIDFLADCVLKFVTDICSWRIPFISDTLQNALDLIPCIPRALKIIISSFAYLILSTIEGQFDWVIFKCNLAELIDIFDDCVGNLLELLTLENTIGQILEYIADNPIIMKIPMFNETTGLFDAMTSNRYRNSTVLLPSGFDHSESFIPVLTNGLQEIFTCIFAFLSELTLGLVTMTIVSNECYVCRRLNFCPEKVHEACLVDENNTIIEGTCNIVIDDVPYAWYVAPKMTDAGSVAVQDIPVLYGNITDELDGESILSRRALLVPNRRYGKQRFPTAILTSIDLFIPQSNVSIVSVTSYEVFTPGKLSGYCSSNISISNGLIPKLYNETDETTIDCQPFPGFIFFNGYTIVVETNYTRTATDFSQTGRSRRIFNPNNNTYNSLVGTIQQPELSDYRFSNRLYPVTPFPRVNFLEILGQIRDDISAPRCEKCVNLGGRLFQCVFNIVELLVNFFTSIANFTAKLKAASRFSRGIPANTTDVGLIMEYLNQFEDLLIEDETRRFCKVGIANVALFKPTIYAILRSTSCDTDMVFETWITDTLEDGLLGCTIEVVNVFVDPDFLTVEDFIIDFILANIDENIAGAARILLSGIQCAMEPQITNCVTNWETYNPDPNVLGSCAGIMADFEDEDEDDDEINDFVKAGIGGCLTEFRTCIGDKTTTEISMSLLEQFDPIFEVVIGFGKDFLDPVVCPFISATYCTQIGNTDPTAVIGCPILRTRENFELECSRFTFCCWIGQDVGPQYDNPLPGDPFFAMEFFGTGWLEFIGLIGKGAIDIVLYGLDVIAAFENFLNSFDMIFNDFSCPECNDPGFIGFFEVCLPAFFSTCLTNLINVDVLETNANALLDAINMTPDLQSLIDEVQFKKRDTTYFVLDYTLPPYDTENCNTMVTKPYLLLSNNNLHEIHEAIINYFVHSEQALINSHMIPPEELLSDEEYLMTFKQYYSLHDEAIEHGNSYICDEYGAYGQSDIYYLEDQDTRRHIFRTKALNNCTCQEDSTIASFDKELTLESMLLNIPLLKIPDSSIRCQCSIPIENHEPFIIDTEKLLEQFYKDLFYYYVDSTGIPKTSPCYSTMKSFTMWNMTQEKIQSYFQEISWCIIGIRTGEYFQTMDPNTYNKFDMIETSYSSVHTIIKVLRNMLSGGNQQFFHNEDTEIQTMETKKRNIENSIYNIKNDLKVSALSTFLDPPSTTEITPRHKKIRKDKKGKTNLYDIPEEKLHKVMRVAGNIVTAVSGFPKYMIKSFKESSLAKKAIEFEKEGNEIIQYLDKEEELYIQRFSRKRSIGIHIPNEVLNVEDHLVYALTKHVHGLLERIPHSVESNRFYKKYMAEKYTNESTLHDRIKEYMAKNEFSDYIELYNDINTDSIGNYIQKYHSSTKRFHELPDNIQADIIELSQDNVSTIHTMDFEKENKKPIIQLQSAVDKVKNEGIVQSAISLFKHTFSIETTSKEIKDKTKQIIFDPENIQLIIPKPPKKKNRPNSNYTSEEKQEKHKEYMDELYDYIFTQYKSKGMDKHFQTITNSWDYIIEWMNWDKTKPYITLKALEHAIDTEDYDGFHKWVKGDVQYVPETGFVDSDIYNDYMMVHTKQYKMDKKQPENANWLDWYRGNINLRSKRHALGPSLTIGNWAHRRRKRSQRKQEDQFEEEYANQNPVLYEDRKRSLYDEENDEIVPSKKSRRIREKEHIQAHTNFASNMERQKQALREIVKDGNYTYSLSDMRNYEKHIQCRHLLDGELEKFTSDRDFLKNFHSQQEKEEYCHILFNKIPKLDPSPTHGTLKVHIDDDDYLNHKEISKDEFKKIHTEKGNEHIHDIIKNKILRSIKKRSGKHRITKEHIENAYKTFDFTPQPEYNSHLHDLGKRFQNDNTGVSTFTETLIGTPIVFILNVTYGIINSCIEKTQFNDTYVPLVAPESLEDLVGGVEEFLDGKEEQTNNFLNDPINYIEENFDFILDIVICDIPEDFDGTNFYNPFCLLSGFLPENLFTFLDPLPTATFPKQISWPDALTTRHKNVRIVDEGSGRIFDNNRCNDCNRQNDTDPDDRNNVTPCERRDDPFDDDDDLVSDCNLTEFETVGKRRHIVIFTLFSEPFENIIDKNFSDFNFDPNSNCDILIDDEGMPIERPFCGQCDYTPGVYESCRDDFGWGDFWDSWLFFLAKLPVLINEAFHTTSIWPIILLVFPIPFTFFIPEFTIASTLWSLVILFTSTTFLTDIFVTILQIIPCIGSCIALPFRTFCGRFYLNHFWIVFLLWLLSMCIEFGRLNEDILIDPWIDTTRYLSEKQLIAGLGSDELMRDLNTRAIQFKRSSQEPDTFCFYWTGGQNWVTGWFFFAIVLFSLRLLLLLIWRILVLVFSIYRLCIDQRDTLAGLRAFNRGLRNEALAKTNYARTEQLFLTAQRNNQELAELQGDFTLPTSSELDELAEIHREDQKYGEEHFVLRGKKLKKHKKRVRKNSWVYWFSKPVRSFIKYTRSWNEYSNKNKKNQ